MENNTPNTKQTKKEYAIIERHYIQCDGLFKPKILKDSERLEMNFKIEMSLKDKSEIIEWMGIQLDSFDMLVYIVLSKLASTDKTRLTADREKDTSIYDILNISKNGDYTSPKIHYIDTSLYEICKLMGYTDTGTNLNKILKSIKRMSCIKVYLYSKANDEKKIPRLIVGSSLIGNLKLENSRLIIAFNPLVASLIDGNINGCTVDLNSIRTLKTDVSKKLIFWLSAWASHDRVQKIGIDKLIGHVWNEEADTPELKRKRKYQIRQSLGEIKKLNWFIQKTDDAYEIKRPKY